MRKQLTTTEVFDNSTCRYMGHAWSMTTSDTYRKCQRTHCQAAQRLQDGQWSDVIRTRLSRASRTQLQAIQPSMFEE